LKLQCTSLQAAGAVVKAYSVASDSWVESAITWNNQPATGSLLDTKTVNATGLVSFNAASFVNSELAGVDKFVSLVLLDNTASSKLVTFGSREATANLRPTLELVYAAPDYAQNFSSAPAGFVTSGGTWTATGGTYRLTAAATDATTHLNNRAIYGTATFGGDFTITAKGSAVSSGGTWDDFAVIFGYVDANNYYFASFNESNNSGTSGIFKVSGGTSTELADITSLIADGVQYNVKVERLGTAIKVYRNGALVSTVTETAAIGGKVGFGTKGNDATFDDLVVTQ